ACRTFIGSPPEMTPFTFAQVCDTQLGYGGYEHDVESFRQAVRQINALHPDFVVICGDLVHSPNEKSFAEFNAIKAGLRMPCHCAPGNHDLGNQPTRESLDLYRRAVGRDYYSFEHKDRRFVVVNTQMWKAPLAGESEKQDAWLVENLNSAARGKTPVFIIGHIPLFVERPVEEENYMNLPLIKRESLLQLFASRGVVAMVGGHTHKLLINTYQGIQIVHGETTSKNFDKRPFGFRIWYVDGMGPVRQDFVPLALSK
ncbi:metallophosphoesterase, partial [bacterium]|nr:metallophosphoesterase [bacterium]